MPTSGEHCRPRSEAERSLEASASRRRTYGFFQVEALRANERTRSRDQFGLDQRRRRTSENDLGVRSKPPRRGGTVLIRMAQQVGHSLTGR